MVVFDNLTIASVGAIDLRNGALAERILSGACVDKGFHGVAPVGHVGAVQAGARRLERHVFKATRCSRHFRLRYDREKVSDAGSQVCVITRLACHFIGGPTDHGRHSHTRLEIVLTRRHPDDNCAYDGWCATGW